MSNLDKASVEHNEDHWKHRSKRMRCGSCMYFVPKLSEVVVRPIGETLGRCRRHAPTMSGWPAVFEADWCGDHKIDENR